MRHLMLLVTAVIAVSGAGADVRPAPESAPRLTSVCTEPAPLAPGSPGWWGLQWSTVEGLDTLLLTPASDGDHLVELRAIGQGLDHTWTEGPFDAGDGATVVVPVALPPEVVGEEVQLLALVSLVDPATGDVRGHAQAERMTITRPNEPEEAWAVEPTAADEAIAEAAVADGTVNDGSPSWEVTR